MHLPNPSHGQFRVQLNRFSAANAQVQILDASGSARQQLTLNAGKNSVVDVNLQGEAKGLYLVRVVSRKGEQVSKVMVQ